MSVLKATWIGWAAIWAVLMLVFLVLSDGEPICSGPFIMEVDDSDPPQCDGPLTGLVTVGPPLFVIGFVVFSGLALLIDLVAKRRHRTRP